MFFRNCMKIGFTIAFLGGCLLVSCHDKKMTNVFDVEDDVEADTVETFVGDTLHLFEEVNPPAAVDELFDDFFYNFMDDAHFQGQRIVYPLPCREDEDEEQLLKEDWPDYDHFKNLEVLAVIYEREQDYELAKDTSMQHVGVEWIPLRRGEVENFHFNRVNGQWMLTDIVKRERESMPNGNFLDFYAQFVADSVFQREALAEPVKVILTSEDGEEEADEELVSKDEWFEMRESLPLPEDVIVNVNYGQASISQNRKILLLQGVSNGMQIKFKFNKIGDDWQLAEIEY